MSAYRVVHTGPKIKLGGLKLGFTISTYQVVTEGIVMTLAGIEIT
tara:strand:- start:317 stop:451 length:135 start_codon:yes stop_codon:yes gene_type:complete